MPRELRLAAAFLLVLASACAAAPVKGAKVRWPPEPDPARIRFVQAITSGADIEKSGWGGFQRALLGTRPISFEQPSSFAFSPDGQLLYMTDQPRGQVVRFDFAQGRTDRFAPDFGMMQPFGIAVDQEGNVYVSEPPLRRVRVFSREGQFLREFGAEATRPTALAIDRKRQVIYVADSSFPESQSHQVRAYSLAGKLLRTLGARGSAPGQFNFPGYLALDKDGNLYVSDMLNFRIQVFDPEGNLIRFFGEAGLAPGQFSRPKGVAVDPRGIVYVVDGETATVQMFNQKNQLLMYFAGKAQLLEYLDMPGPIAIHPDGKRIFVGEQSAQLPRINVYEFIEVPEPAPVPATPRQPPAGPSPR